MSYPKNAYDFYPRLNQPPVRGLQPMHDPSLLERFLLRRARRRASQSRKKETV